MTKKRARSSRTKRAKGGARAVATNSLIRAAASFPDIGLIQVDTSGLDARDASLAKAIVGVVLRRWITLEDMLNQALDRPLEQQDPILQAVLLSGAAQLCFLDRLPPHAVVDESVELAKQLLHRGAGGLVNAVLRRLVREVLNSKVADIAISSPSVVKNNWIDVHASQRFNSRDIDRLSNAYSHPPILIRQWIRKYGLSTATQIMKYGTLVPPVLVLVEPGFSGDPNVEYLGELRAGMHYVIWKAAGSGLEHFLNGHRGRRVQDPTAACAVAATSSMKPKVIVDYCAGLGTKTRQLALTHPQAKIIATDVNPSRVVELMAIADRFENVQAVDIHNIDRAVGQDHADLVVLDVPCSNTGVLARRPEARYRFNAERLRGLVHKQREIIGRGVKLLAPGGVLLYTTCSIEPRENQKQVLWLCNRYKANLTFSHAVLPGASGGIGAYRDGGYYAIIHKL